MVFIFHNGENKYTEILRKSGLDDTFLAIIGGDGTFLRAISTFKSGTVPIVLGFDYGTVGYLTPLKLQELQSIINNIKDGQFITSKRPRLFVSTHDILIVNELVLRSKAFGLNKFEISIDGYEFILYASELIISTNVGSSGYNLSLGGPLAFMDCIILNCVGANQVRFAPIVLSIDTIIKVCAKNCYGCFDGHEILNGNDVFEIQKGDFYEIVTNIEYSKFSNIKNWFHNTKSKYI